jgi:hypothetical protein
MNTADESLGYLERIELVNRELGGTIRKDEGYYSKLRFIDRWECSDGSVHDKWADALEHEKSINVRARHRGF